MPKREAGIRVTVLFDGERQAKDVFTDLVIEKYRRDADDILPKTDSLLYHGNSIPTDYGRLDCAEKSP